MKMNLLKGYRMQDNHTPSRMMGPSCITAVLILLPSCGSVSVPEDQWYRLLMPAPVVSSETGTMRPDRSVETHEAALPGTGILRVARPVLAATVAMDRLMVADGPVRLRAYEFLRWSGPLDEMIADSILTSYARAGGFASVKGAGDPGGEDLLLTSRVLEFHQLVLDGSWRARAVLDLRLSAPADGTLFFHREFVADLPVLGRHPEDVVVALSMGVAQVAAWSLEEARRAGALDLVAAGPPGR